jgi:hypothetical protein
LSAAIALPATPTKTTAARARALIELCTLIVLLSLSDLLSREIARAYRVLHCRV